MAKRRPRLITLAEQKRQKRLEKKRMLKMWSEIVKMLGRGNCAVCGSARRVQAHHLLPKELYQELRYEVMNGICLCSSHHKFNKYSFHRNPTWSVEWLRRNRPDQFKWCMENMGDANTTNSRPTFN